MDDSVRKTAVTILLNIQKNGAYINAEMKKLREKDIYDNKDIRFIGELVNGVVKRKLTIDYIISLHSSTKLQKISPFVLNVLRIGIYQIIFMDKIPKRAAVDECVKLIKKSSVSRLSGYVNAVLRAVSEDDLNMLSDDNAEGISVKYSYPMWIVKHWSDEFGIDFAKNMMKSLNQKSPLYIRCNPLVVTPPELEKKLADEGIDYSPIVFDFAPGYNYSFCIRNIKDIRKIPGYEDGAFYIQDPSAALAAYMLNPQEGETVIDLCAAPGGKSLLMAGLMKNIGRIISCDIYEHKIKVIAENSLKYGVKIVEPTLNDASVLKKEWIETADRVLCDVPCSGFGIIRKKPDIKYARRSEDIRELSELALSILENGSKYLKKGGTLIYSTCTVERAENEDVINKFLKYHSNFSAKPFDKSNFMYTSYPNVTDTDGFFICKLIRNG